MAGKSALIRWTPFLTSFDHIDEAIEAADPSVSRDEFRRLRVQLVEMLYDAEDDGRKVEGLCVILDGVMVESLATLQLVPADVVPRVLASSADLANTIGELRSHDSERVRALARGIIRQWKASLEGDIVRITAAMAKLDALPQQLPPSKGMVASHVSDGRIDNTLSNPKSKKNQPNIREDKPCPKKAATQVVGVALVKTSEAAGPRKTAPAACIGRATMADKQASLKMESTKRKLREGYQEVADAKRQRKNQIVEAPEMMEQRQRKMHPIMREQSRAISGKSTAARRSLCSSFDRV